MRVFYYKNKLNIRSLVITLSLVLVLASCSDSKTTDEGLSIVREWNEILLQGVRTDFARPTVHARNLYHFSAASYDAWSAFSERDKSYFLGNTLAGYECSFEQQAVQRILNDSFGNIDKVIIESISFANYRLLKHRFRLSPGRIDLFESADELMDKLGFDTEFESTNYTQGSAAALGNYIAECYINYGLQDGSNEANGYANKHYNPLNPVIEPVIPGNPNIVDLDRWQIISLQNAIDQSGNPVNSAPPFLSPEWGDVEPFALTLDQSEVYTRDGGDYRVYLDPGAPPSHGSDAYRWNFSIVAFWSSLLDASVENRVDISPGGTGNLDIASLANEFSEYPDTYNIFTGGDAGEGHELNPATGQAYPAQMIKMGDYARVLAEFWADGPDSETPPGHWFVILNKVNDNPELIRKIGGEGRILSKLEWDIKSYFVLGGAMHDSAIAAWSVKGYYDYIRPISAIRAMADLGQSSSMSDASYDSGGLPLVNNFIELVELGDPLAGASNEHVGKIKLFSWRGPDFISNPETDQAGVDWILAENWWPYQRPTFVTPPFAGYVSGHSTFSRAAAEVLTLFTGSAFFPGGIGEFEIKKNEFLVFEEGPSEDMVLQWATYRDASDQSSLSRIWGGIHPPVDDIDGRRMGEQVGIRAFQKASGYFGL